ncbi:LuxR C-terminal-related transcriptional regulator [Parapedobacter sp. 2B3]|uniref:helix-turn-helix domain-containing protein n=1 Tax=Parapedobacter sp. 2B3 TaxID=3342381 RepID=UPI0035B594BE
MTFEKFLDFKMRYDIRYQKKDGSYCRILYQAIIIEHDGLGRILRTFGTYTDINYLKEGGAPTLSFIGMNGMPSYIDVPLKNRNLLPKKDNITYRERQVLKLLAEGMLSKEIASTLGISKETVDRHRKNMLHKKGLANTSELVGKAIRQGWI